MTWEIIAGFITFIGFIGSFVGVCVKMVVPLTQSIVKLTEKMDQLCEKYDVLDEKRKEEHKRLWDHNVAQDKKLEDHAQRLHDLDGKW